MLPLMTSAKACEQDLEAEHSQPQPFPLQFMPEGPLRASVARLHTIMLKAQKRNDGLRCMVNGMLLGYVRALRDRLTVLNEGGSQRGGE